MERESEIISVKSESISIFSIMFYSESSSDNLKNRNFRVVSILSQEQKEE